MGSLWKDCRYLDDVEQTRTALHTPACVKYLLCRLWQALNVGTQPRISESLWLPLALTCGFGTIDRIGESVPRKEDSCSSSKATFLHSGG
jgi:hypothetical protein